MTPKDIQTIYELLASRVVPTSAREGAAIMALGAKLVKHFASPTAAELVAGAKAETTHPPAS